MNLLAAIAITAVGTLALAAAVVLYLGSRTSEQDTFDPDEYRIDDRHLTERERAQRDQVWGAGPW